MTKRKKFGYAHDIHLQMAVAAREEERHRVKKVRDALKRGACGQALGLLVTAAQWSGAADAQAGASRKSVTPRRDLARTRVGNRINKTYRTLGEAVGACFTKR